MVTARDATSMPSTSTDETVVFGVASIGLLALDAASVTSPTVELVYAQSEKDDCCSPTALALAAGIAVMSIPIGTLNPPWCQCEHSQLIGVEVRLGRL
jgi:hypothetical protein